MSRTHYTGKAGHLAVMGELALRGYNVAMPEIDVGDDIFVVRDDTGAMWRLQVKTSRAKKQAASWRYQFRVKENAIQNPQSPELHFVFVMRKGKRWRFLVMDRAVLRNYVVQNGLGTMSNAFRQIGIVLHKDGTAVCSGIDLKKHLEDWYAWPRH